MKADASLLFAERKQDLPSSPRSVVDLFCGAGGLSEGFRMAGFDSVLGIDDWSTACDTFATHHESARVVNNKIENISNSVMLELSGLKEGELGILCGGPPCQGFSVAGKRLSDDPRNHLLKEFLRAARVFFPAGIVMENVPNLLNNAAVAGALTTDLDELETNNGVDYESGFSVANAAGYGVPQTRPRLVTLSTTGRGSSGHSLPGPSETSFQGRVQRNGERGGRGRYLPRKQELQVVQLPLHPSRRNV